MGNKLALGLTLEMETQGPETSQGPEGDSEAQNEAIGATFWLLRLLPLTPSAHQPSALKASRFFPAHLPPPLRPPLSSLWAAFRGLPLLPPTWLW